jgi:hypothetical protein
MFMSTCCELGPMELPEFSGLRVMMMPIIVGDVFSIPMPEWRKAADRIFNFEFFKHGTSKNSGKVGYLTIDEKVVQPKQTHRRAGLHVDGIYHDGRGKWSGGGGGWSTVGNGAITVSSHVGCRAWNQEFTQGWPGPEGECDHLAYQLRPECEVIFKANTAYWFDGMCVHESMVQTEPVARQFVRLSLPSDAPWFEGYTRNPLGIQPTGVTLSRREFMDE